jgi:multicomponent Na+:H+ antiporter subunit D
VFVFLEISSLSTYVLIAQGSYRDKRALTAAYDYLIMGTIGATFFVIGLGLLYMATGTLNMADIADRIADQGANRTVRTAFAFIVVGIGLKIAIYPLHLWLPNAYTYAPSAVTAFLAASATKVAIYVLLRFTFSVFQPAFLFEVNTLEFIILPFAVMAMFAASFIAIFQSDFKRMLAYSSIAQIGYMLLGIALLTETGLTAAIVHLFNHGVTKAALFMGVGAFVLRAGGSFYNDIEGLGKTMPWTSAAVVIGGLSLIGVPGTAGFISKWVLVQAALEKGWWPIALLVLASSLLAVIYVWRVIETLYLKQPAEGIAPKEAPLSMLLPLWIMASACIYFGFDTDMTLSAARTAAEGLLAGSAGMR